MGCSDYIESTLFIPPLLYINELGLGVLGTINIMFLCKWLSSAVEWNKFRCYRLVKKYNYQLYLYSDPLNYVLLAVAFGIADSYFADLTNYSLMFLIRIIFTFAGALVVAAIINWLRPCISKSALPSKRV